MFDDKYPYRSSMSKAVKKSFFELSKKIKKEIKPKRILEIGSNDGSFMQNFNKKIVVGVEPCKNVEEITKRKKFSIAREIRNLSKIVKPNIGIITNIGAAHIQNFKNLDDIAIEYKFLNDELIAINLIALNDIQIKYLKS